MTNYEMLTVMPGILAETDIAPLVSSVKETVEKFGGCEVAVHDMGKSRIAYPIKHIRYGYFYLTQFLADKDKINEIRNRVQLLSNLLRVVIREYNPAKQRMDADKMSLTPLSNVVGTSSGSEEYTFTHYSREIKKPEHVFAQQFSPVAAVATVKIEAPETKEEFIPAPAHSMPDKLKLSIDDIDAQLDKILEKDLDNI